MIIDYRRLLEEDDAFADFVFNIIAGSIDMESLKVLYALYQSGIDSNKTLTALNLLGKTKQ